MVLVLQKWSWCGTSLVITSQDADAEGVGGEHDDERYVERHYRSVQNELAT